MGRGNMKKLKTAIVYDFDGTLSPGNMQEHSFINKMKTTKKAFWKLVKDGAKKHNADEILVYMKLMLELSHEKKIPVTRQELKKHGESIPLFEGLADGSWFKRMNKFAAAHNLDLEHYIVSSGNLEIVEGCKIAKQFKHIFASQFVFDTHDVAAWPGITINYTTKTQYLFRINKGILNSWDNARINEYTPEADRPIPFDRMIFIGDGDTDIPSMKMVAFQGGHSIAVYDPQRDERSLDKIHRLISQDRVSFVAAADYTEHSQLDILVSGLLGRIALKAKRK